MQGNRGRRIFFIIFSTIIIAICDGTTRVIVVEPFVRGRNFDVTLQLKNYIFMIRGEKNNYILPALPKHTNKKFSIYFHFFLSSKRMNYNITNKTFKRLKIQQLENRHR